MRGLKVKNVDLKIFFLLDSIQDMSFRVAVVHTTRVKCFNGLSGIEFEAI